MAVALQNESSHSITSSLRTHTALPLAATNFTSLYIVYLIAHTHSLSRSYIHTSLRLSDFDTNWHARSHSSWFVNIDCSERSHVSPHMQVPSSPLWQWRRSSTSHHQHPAVPGIACLLRQSVGWYAVREGWIEVEGETVIRSLLTSAHNKKIKYSEILDT